LLLLESAHIFHCFRSGNYGLAGRNLSAGSRSFISTLLSASGPGSDDPRGKEHRAEQPSAADSPATLSSQAGELEHTALYSTHRAAGATLVDFQGWSMPVRYGAIPDEHVHVRTHAGLFDLGHMGRLELIGPDATRFVDRVQTNHYAAMRPGDARYTLILNERGTTIDDAIVYKLPIDDAASRVFVVVNAGNRAEVMRWFGAHRGELNVEVKDRSAELGMIALQGPEAVSILPRALEFEDGAGIAEQKYYSIALARFEGEILGVARTGYTGEDGFELYPARDQVETLWNRLLEVGGDAVRPIGLGARDTLRLEAGMPLYGHELDSTTTPLEAGLGFAVRWKKPEPFVGQEALEELRREQGSTGPARRLVGLRVEGRRVARQGMTLHPGGGHELEVGRVTSGAPSPTLGYPIAFAYLEGNRALEEDGTLEVDIRGRRHKVERHKTPFFSRTRRKKHSPQS
jgi:aminomethyltransferase